MEYEDGEKNSRSGNDEFGERFTSPLNEGSLQLHELYLSHRNAGFSPVQALYLLAATITGNPGLPPKGLSEDEDE